MTNGFAETSTNQSLPSPITSPPPPPPPPPSLPRPKRPPPPPPISNIGILRLSVYIPRPAVSQSALEKYDNVSPGKYTIGLGQEYMTFVTDKEDAISLALTAVTSLMKETGLPYEDVGRLDVGTETIIDKSKSIKTSLMKHFTQHGNPEIEGLDTTNACYGSTQALFNAIAWAESTSWDGRYGIVVATDIAVYKKGPARPTAGAAAVAILIGPNAPIRFEPALRSTVMGDSYDFFKPIPSVEYPTVRGLESVETFLYALNECYNRFHHRASKLDDIPFATHAAVNDYFVFHAPFNKMVRKSMACLIYNDFMKQTPKSNDLYKDVEQFRQPGKPFASLDKEAMRAFVKLSNETYERKCAPGAWLAQQIGNCYTASLYSSLAALLETVGDSLIDKRIVMFAFGSGFAASMFSLRVTQSVKNVVVGTPLKERLSNRLVFDPCEYSGIMDLRENSYGRVGHEPNGNENTLTHGTFYLEKVTEDGERIYEQKPYR